jgi:DNA-binding transcriptional ArsR family regulator
LTIPIDITDARLVKAYAHPLRIEILSLLDNRVASPKQIAEELDTPLPNTAYHVRQLAALGLVELVRRTVRGGAVEHHYTTKVRPTIPDELWAELPEIVKRAATGGAVQQALSEMIKAVDVGGFDRDDAHLTRTPARLDAKGWTAVARELHKCLKRVDSIVEQTAARLEKTPDAETVEAMAVMALFERPTMDDGAGTDRASASRSGAGSRARSSRGTARTPAS